MRIISRMLVPIGAAAAFGLGVSGQGFRGQSPISAAEIGDCPYPKPSEVRREALAVQARLMEAMERVKPAVVAVFRGDPGAQGQQGAGSGVLIDPEGYALTNYHVVGQTLEVRCGLPDGHIYPAKVVGRDPTGDIALLRLSGKKTFPSVPLGDSDALVPGDWAIAMGNPFNLSTDFQPTVTLGIVSGLNRFLQGQQDNTLVYTNAIQIDTSINPGNSGGPLFNAAGELVGINGRIAGRPGRGRVNVGAGFAISINQIKAFLPMLREGRDVYHARLGVGVKPDAEGRVAVTSVTPGSAAGEAGILPGDIIRRFNGQEVRSIPDLQNMIGVLPAGTDAMLTLVREGVSRDLEVELEGLPAGRDVAAARGRGRPLVEASAPTVPPNPPTPEALLEAHAKAVGEAQAREAILGTRTAAEVTFYASQRLTAQLAVWSRRPDRYRSELKYQVTQRTPAGTTTQPVTQITGYDGAEGWVNRTPGGLMAMPGNDLEELRRGMLEDRTLLHGERPRDLTLTYLGEAAIGEQRVHVVQAKAADLGSRWWYFDATSHLLVRLRYQSLLHGLWSVEDFSDHREVRGVKTAFHIETYTDGRLRADIVVKSAEVDNALPDSLFKAK